MYRRRNGSSLGLVLAVTMLVTIIGVFIFFLCKLLGGSREISNATDAGTLNVAKHIIKDAKVKSPPEFEDCEYPLNSGYINLLTYNRCVAKAIMIAYNASQMTGAGSYSTNANQVLDDLETLGNQLTGSIKNSWNYFDQVSNQARMASVLNIKSNRQCVVAYMKGGGPTNVFFNSQQIPNLTLPASGTNWKPKNESSYAANVTGYLPGYTTLSVLGRTVYGVPVFPQQLPHLVSGDDFNKCLTGVGAAPPNAVQTSSKLAEVKGGLLGAVACAIVGAVDQGSGSGVASQLLGSGYQFPAAASYGYLEFGNYPANGAPPGHGAGDFHTNIFNNELFLDKDFLALGDGAWDSESSSNITFGVDGAAVMSWVNWAVKYQTTPPRRPKPPPPFTGGAVYVINETTQKIVELKPGRRPSTQTINWLASCHADLPAAMSSPGYPACWCTQQLTKLDGLKGTCVEAIPAMENVYHHKLPWQESAGTQQFTQVDWAKARVLADFEGVSPKNRGGYNNWCSIDFNGSASGLGIYPHNLVAARVPDVLPNMPTPANELPLQKSGTIYELMQAVQPADCLKTTVDAIAQRCKQIQPRTTDADVMRLLSSKATSLLPMAEPGRAQTWENANKLYIYLPEGDLSKDLIISHTDPPKLTHRPPDGCCASPDNTNPGYAHTYGITGNIVDAFQDQKLDARPYLEINGSLTVSEHADWQPGTGADYNFGRMTFQEVGNGQALFSQIN